MTYQSGSEISGAAVGGVVFAATMMILVGIFQALQGLAAVMDDGFFVVVDDYAYRIDVSTWGWIHLILGIVVALTGFYLFAGSRVAAYTTIAIASLAALANFLFLPHSPVWSMLVIAFCILVIWAVTRAGILDDPR